MKRNPNNKLLLGSLVAFEVVASALAWRDLARRSDDQVRGNKNAWRVFVVLNPGNSLLYWIFGRPDVRRVMANPPEDPTAPPSGRLLETDRRGTRAC